MKGGVLMDCDMFLNMLDDYDNLSELEKEQLNNHAKECESCRRELEFLESVIATTKTLPKLEVGEDFLKDLNLRIDQEDIKVNRRTRHFKRNWQKYSAVAASLVLVAVIGANSDMFVDKMAELKEDNEISSYPVFFNRKWKCNDGKFKSD